jgi:hypothetical protein
MVRATGERLASCALRPACRHLTHAPHGCPQISATRCWCTSSAGSRRTSSSGPTTRPAPPAAAARRACEPVMAPGRRRSVWAWRGGWRCTPAAPAAAPARGFRASTPRAHCWSGARAAAASGPTASRWWRWRAASTPGTSRTGRITCGRRCGAPRRGAGCTWTPARRPWTRRCCMRRAGARSCHSCLRRGWTRWVHVGSGGGAAPSTILWHVCTESCRPHVGPETAASG